jgi:hypothetical protein
MQHYDETLATSMKHLKHMLATCMYMQHPDLLLQHPNKKFADKTFRTYT